MSDWADHRARPPYPTAPPPGWWPPAGYVFPAPLPPPPPPRRAWPVALGIVAAVVLVVGAAAGIAVARSRHAGEPRSAASRPSQPSPLETTDELPPAAVNVDDPGTVQPTPATVPDTSGIAEVRAWATASTAPGAITHEHVLGPVTYAITPPVGGPHAAVWANCGVYTLAIANERAVHDLEHGVVWVTYRRHTSAAVVASLTSFVEGQREVTTKGAPSGSRYMLLSPWPNDGLASPIVLSAWGRQLGVDSPDDPRAQAFIDAFRASPNLSYEGGLAPCDGQPVDVGGRPAAS